MDTRDRLYLDKVGICEKPIFTSSLFSVEASMVLRPLLCCNWLTTCFSSRSNEFASGYVYLSVGSSLDRGSSTVIVQHLVSANQPTKGHCCSSMVIGLLFFYSRSVVDREMIGTSRVELKNQLGSHVISKRSVVWFHPFSFSLSLAKYSNLVLIQLITVAHCPAPKKKKKCQT